MSYQNDAEPEIELVDESSNWFESLPILNEIIQTENDSKLEYKQNMAKEALETIKNLLLKVTNIVIDERIGNKLSDFINEPVYRVLESETMGRSYMDPFDFIIIPIKVTDHGVYVLYNSMNLYNDNVESEIRLFNDDYGWAPSLPIITESIEIEKEVGFSFYQNKANSIFEKIESLLIELATKKRRVTSSFFCLLDIYSEMKLVISPTTQLKIAIVNKNP